MDGTAAPPRGPGAVSLSAGIRWACRKTQPTRLPRWHGRRARSGARTDIYGRLYAALFDSVTVVGCILALNDQDGKLLGRFSRQLHDDALHTASALRAGVASWRRERRCSRLRDPACCQRPSLTPEGTSVSQRRAAFMTTTSISPSSRECCATRRAALLSGRTYRRCEISVPAR